MDSDYPPLVHADLTEQVHGILKDKILRREIESGQQISVPEVARALQVSRTPVTDALKRLASEGLVVIKPRVGTFVTQLTKRDVAELFDIRLLMELHAAKTILQIDHVEQFLEMSRHPMQALDAAVLDSSYRDYDSFIANDRELHVSLVRASDNQHLLRLYKNLNLHVHAARAYYVKNIENAMAIQCQHRAIVEGFEARNADAICQVLTVHINDVKNRILNILDDLGGML